MPTFRAWAAVRSRTDGEFTIDALQADAWWILGTASVLEAGAEWRHSSGSYDYEDEADFELLFLTPGAPSEPSRTRAVSLRPRGDQYGGVCQRAAGTDS